MKDAETSLNNCRFESVQGLEDLSQEEIEQILLDQIEERLSAADVFEDEASVTGIAVIGSRGRGTAREDSDLDVLLGYEGSIREDDMFAILNDPDYETGKISINGLEVDVNPVREEESGTFEQALEKAKKYDKEIIAKNGQKN